MPRFRFRLKGLPLAALCAGLALAPLAAAAQPAPAATNAVGAYLAARAAGERNDTSAEAAYYSRLLLTNPGDPFLTDRTFNARLRIGDVSLAMNQAQTLIAIDPAHEPARLTLAARAIRNGDYDAADAHLDAISGDLITDLTLVLLRAWIIAGRDDVPGALTFLETLDGEPWFAPFLAYHGALIADFGGDHESALRLIEEAVSLDASLWVLEAYAIMLARAGEPGTAEQMLADYVSFAGSDPGIDALIETLQARTELPPVAASIRRGAGEVFFTLALALFPEIGDATAVPYLQLSRYLDPSDMVTVISLGELLQTVGHYADAIDVLEDMDPASPLWPDAEIRIAVSLSTLGDDEEAIARLNELIEARPDAIAAGIALGSIYRADSRFAEAGEVFDAAVRQITEPQPGDWSLFYLRGIAFERTGRWDEAEADFQTALELSPGQPEVLNYLGYTWLDRGEKYQEAYELIRIAAERRPNDGYIVDSLGWAHYLLGNYEQAVTELERAITLSPTQPELRDHLGDAYWRVGRRLEAVYQWTHARDLDPRPELLEIILDKIENGLEAKDDGDV